DSLAHRRSLVSLSCTSGTRTNPRHSSFTLPGTRPSPSLALVSPTGATGTLPRTLPRPASVSYASRSSRCSVFVHG
ncbi:hypothetical protein C0993_001517, partial [Termitomyces sp. T159_Od127]